MPRHRPATDTVGANTVYTAEHPSLDGAPSAEPAFEPDTDDSDSAGEGDPE
jgi:hypothetical protein